MYEISNNDLISVIVPIYKVEQYLKECIDSICNHISFIDSDDFIEVNFIEKLYKLCIDNDVDIEECNYLEFENEIEKTENKEMYKLLKTTNVKLLAFRLRVPIKLILKKDYKKLFTFYKFRKLMRDIIIGKN